MMLLQRINRDFFSGNRISQYKRILKCAVTNGYEFHTVLSFENIKERVSEKSKIIILRRDVDTADYVIMNDFLKEEIEHGAKCSYYFRLNTVDYDFMSKVHNAGGEASYHYEELASYAYCNHIKDKTEVLRHIDEIRELFIRNYNMMKAKSHLPLLTVASHGDFVNKKIGITNVLIVNDQVREKNGIIREAYDDEHMKYITYRIADHSSPNFMELALAAIERGEPIIELLTHPRQWNSNIRVNLKENITRCCKGLMY